MSFFSASPREVNMLQFPGALRGCSRTKKPSRIPRDALKGLQSECARTCPWPSGPRAPHGVEEHRVANVDVEDQDERSQGGHCLHLHAPVRAQAEEQTATRERETWVPQASKSRG